MIPVYYHTERGRGKLGTDNNNIVRIAPAHQLSPDFSQSKSYFTQTDFSSGFRTKASRLSEMHGEEIPELSIFSFPYQFEDPKSIKWQIETMPKNT